MEANPATESHPLKMDFENGSTLIEFAFALALAMRQPYAKRVALAVARKSRAIVSNATWQHFAAAAIVSNE
jgi:hypothetical protein